MEAIEISKSDLITLISTFPDGQRFVLVNGFIGTADEDEEGRLILQTIFGDEDE